MSDLLLITQNLESYNYSNSRLSQILDKNSSLKRFDKQLY